MPEADLLLHLRFLAFSNLRGCTPVILIYNVVRSSRPMAREGGRQFKFQTRLRRREK